MGPRLGRVSGLPRAVVVGLELNGLGLTRSLANRGVPVHALAMPNRQPADLSRSLTYLTRLPAWNEPALIETLVQVGRSLDQPAVLFNTKDEGVSWVSKHRHELEPFYRIALPDHDTVDLLLNKGRFYPLAAAEGWPLPKYWAADSEGALEAIRDRLVFPCILKPQVRNSDYRRQNVPKAFKVGSIDDLRSIYRLVARWEAEVVISEWIEGRDDQLVSCRGYWNAKGEPVIRFVARKLLQWPVELGNMAIVEPAPTAWWPEAIELAATIFRKTGMYGLGAVEFKRRPDGQLVILEPCVGRTVYSHELAVLNGYDIPGACYADLAFRESIEPSSLPTPTIKLIDGRRARSASRVYRQRGTMSARDVAAVFGGRRRDMLWRRNDPLPAIVESLRAGMVAARRALGKVTGLARRPPDPGRPDPSLGPSSVEITPIVAPVEAAQRPSRLPPTRSVK